MTFLRDLVVPAGTLALGAAGAALFVFLGFPAPYLTGPALVVTIAGVAGANVALPGWLSTIAFVVVGLGLGATVTPEVVGTAVRWPLSFAIMVVVVVACLRAGGGLLARGFAFQPLSAFLSAVPGHMSYVLGMALDRDVDLGLITLVQSIRVLALTLAVPALLALWGVEGEWTPPAAAPMGALAVLVTFAAGLALGRVFVRLRVPAGYLLGGMVASAALHLGQVVPGPPPIWLTATGFITMGALIGTRFRGQTLASLRLAAAAGAAVTVVTVLVAAAGALLSAWLLDLPAALLLVAFAPGGVEAMAAMSAQLGLDPTFVTAHHVFRLLVLTVLVPLMAPRREAAVSR